MIASHALGLGTIRSEKRISGLSARTLSQGVLIASAGMIGFALILWIAANWDGIGRFERFAIVMAALSAGAISSALVASLRTPGQLVAFAATGGLLALIGQTYQTGADTWQLFAVWAALGLPFALAARSDAVWTCWVVVSMAAISLWQASSDIFTPIFFGVSSASTASILAQLVLSWFVAMAIAAVLAPHAMVDRWIGRRRWAFTLAQVLVILNVTAGGIYGAFGGAGSQHDVPVCALIMLAAIAVFILMRERLDVLPLTMTAFGIDAVVLVEMASWMRPRGWGDFMFTGLMAAGLVALSVFVVMAVVRRAAADAPETKRARRFAVALGRIGAGGTSLASVPSLTAADASPRPWPVIALSACGALLAAIPFVVSIALLLGSALMSKGPAALVIGAGILAGGVAMLLRARSLILEHLGTIALALGFGLVGYALFRDLGISMASFATAMIAFALAFALARPWLSGLLAMAAVSFLVTALVATAGLSGRAFQSNVLLVWAIFVMVWAVAVEFFDRHREWLEPVASRPTLDAMIAGAAVAMILALSVGAGPTFMLDGLIGAKTTRVHTVDAALLAINGRSLLSVLTAIGAVALAFFVYPPTRGAIGAAAAIAAVALAFVMPALGPVLLVLAISLATGRRSIAILACVAVLWIVGNFYYAISMPLTRKATILAIAGLSLAAVALVAYPFAEAAPFEHLDKTSAHGRSWLPSILAIAGLTAVLAVSASSIRASETIIRDGSPVYVELMPADPRSLMQGDYMALRFRLPQSRGQFGSAPVYAVGALDASRIAHLTRIAGEAAAADGEVRMRLARRGRAWVLVTNAWFFKEGEAAKWVGARFGEFRLLPNGRALLVGLADAKLQPIR